MNKNLTEIVYILDRSGSMGGLEEDTIGGFMSIPDGIDYELNDTGWAEEINEDYNRRGKKVRR